MAIILPDLSAVISGIIILGANGGEQLFLPKIYAVLYQFLTRFVANPSYSWHASIGISKKRGLGRFFPEFPFPD